MLKPGTRKRLIVIGGGAAGFFCAVNAAAANPALQVVLAEKTGKLLSKVKVSGGGRCNVTHACFDINELAKNYPRGQHFVKKTFHQFNTKDTIEWFEKRNVQLKTEPDGRMFPVTDSSQTIINCLLNEADKYGVQILLHTEIKKIEKHTDVFELQSNHGTLSADFICIACGSFSKLAQFDWLKQLGHSIEEPLPSLFTFNIPGNNIRSLMGVSSDNASVKIKGSKLMQTGAILITHWGLSGPAVLKLSAYAAKELSAMHYDFTVIINWLPGYNENSLREEWHGLRNQFSAQKINNKKPFSLPQRLWSYFLDECGISHELRWADVPAASQNKLIKTLTAQEVQVKGKTTFKEEFVTCGGITLSEVDANTMQSKIAPGLFFAGEVMDADGITGGFNFQHAWTSGWIAGKSIAALV